MPAIKKISSQIAEDMRELYETGERTQAELADLFAVSVPTVNKTVRGVRPVKRKYKRSTAKQERNAAMVEAYNPDEGVGMKELAQQFEMTHQNVSIILKKAGINPQKEYFGRLKEQAGDRKVRVEQEREAKREAKRQKLQELSELWKSGCTVEEFRVAGGLKTCNAAQVKIVNLRKKHGEDMFPRRRGRKTEVAEVAEVVEKDQVEESVSEEAEEEKEQVVAVAENGNGVDEAELEFAAAQVAEEAE